jgi:hypothetical protein
VSRGIALVPRVLSYLSSGFSWRQAWLAISRKHGGRDVNGKSLPERAEAQARFAFAAYQNDDRGPGLAIYLAIRSQEPESGSYKTLRKLIGADGCLQQRRVDMRTR